MYPIAPLLALHNFAATMLCRLFGKADTTKCPIEWATLIDVVVNSMIMNWNTILLDNLAMAIRVYRCNRIVSNRVIPPFSISSYVMDAICFCSHFPNMGC